MINNLARRDESSCTKADLRYRVAKNSALKSIYGITLDQYFDLLEEQDYGCALCGGTKTSKRAVNSTESWLWVDHDHETGQVRGLLCEWCNTNLGGYESLVNRVGHWRIENYLHSNLA